MNEGKRLSKKTIWGFSVGTLGEYFVYFLFFNYFTYYLTDIIGIKAAVASTILSLAMIWDAITDPIVGYVNDVSRKGWRRRIMMKRFFIPFVITYALCFIRPHLEMGPALYVYYGFVALAFWLSFTCEQVPFYGLLPEIAKHPDDRLRIREVMAFIGNGGNLAVSIVPVIVELFLQLGFIETTSWSLTMGILGFIGGLGFLVSYFSTKGLDTPVEELPPKEDTQNIFASYKEVLKTKGYIISVVIYLLSTLFINLIFCCIVYVGSNKLQLSAGQLSIVTAAYTFSGALFVPLIGLLDKKLGSHKAFKASVIAALIAYVIIGIVGFRNMGIMLLHGVITAICFVLFTAYNYIMFYESSDLTYLRTGKQLEGSVISFATFGYKIGSACSSAVLGIALTIIGYDGTAEVKDPAMLSKFDYLLTYIPAILLVVILVLLFVYPVKEKHINLIKEAKFAKDDGKEYSTSGIEELLK
ncbi:MAG: MFS transporter [Lachnospiraceae bacterium]